MSQYKKKKTKTNHYEILHGNYALIPLLVVIFLIPLIVRLHRYDPNLSQFYWFTTPTNEADVYQIDVFLYWKSRIFTALGAIMGIYLVYRLTNRKFRQSLKKTVWLYLLIAYGILTLLSTLFSEYRSFGFSGIHEQFESVWVVLSYCALTVFAYVVVQNTPDLAALRRTFFALFTVLCALGITQLRGKDFWETTLGRRIMVPEKYAAYRKTLQFNFSHSGTHQVYLCFYNPNYVGMFASLVLPFSVFCIFTVKRWWQKILWAIISVGLAVCTFNSGSKTFLISIVISILFALFVCRRAILRRILFVIPVCIALFFGLRAYFRHINLDPVQYVKNAITLRENNYLLEDIRFTENDVVIDYNNATLHVKYTAEGESATLICLDDDGGALEYTVREDGYIVLADPTFSGILFRFTRGNEYYPWLAAIYIRGATAYFTQTETGYRYINNVGKFADPIKAPAALFTNYDSFASTRGYLWSRTIPMLRHSLILGTGADSFSLVFPHNDLPGRINAGYYTALVTKPHNLYLQIGVQHGVLALLCFLSVCLIYIAQSLALYWKSNFSDKNHWFGAGIMLGVVGYLIAGLSNDSCVAIAPVFWALLGIGFAVNQLNRKAAAEMALAAAAQKTAEEKAALENAALEKAVLEKASPENTAPESAALKNAAPENTAPQPAPASGKTSHPGGSRSKKRKKSGK